MATVAYIPARGGSKRIPHKNIREFNGVPALGRVIHALLSVEIFDRVVVSTDSDAIASVAYEYGASTIQRVPDMANDFAGILDVVKSEFENIEQLAGEIDVLACVLPTALLMDPRDLCQAVQVVTDGISQFAVSVGRFKYPIQRALEIDSSSNISMVWPENYSVRSQDLPERHHDAGQFYVGTREAWNTRKTMFDDPARGIIIDEWRVQDIDVEADWKRAEMLWRVLESE
jgi:pseudaminic acid cytidylyltransferase